MNKIYTFLNYKYLYERCIIASVAHAIMVGKYGFLSAEQSWDGDNYNFQNMEGIRGVISFNEEQYVYVVQNSCDKYNDIKIPGLFYGADANIIELAQNESFPYMLIDYNGEDVPFVSAAFWGNRIENFSNQSEEDIIRLSDKTIMPLLYSEDDAKKYWSYYYEMNAEQTKMMEDIYNRRICSDGEIELTKDEKDNLLKWFGDIDECIESFRELKILLD